MIARQQPDGWFGPKGARTSLDGDPDFWPHMPALYAIRSYHEVTGDPEVLPFLTKLLRLPKPAEARDIRQKLGGLPLGATTLTAFTGFITALAMRF